MEGETNISKRKARYNRGNVTKQHKEILDYMSELKSITCERLRNEGFGELSVQVNIAYYIVAKSSKSKDRKRK